MTTTQYYNPGFPRVKKYGITEKKKAELDDLANQVLDAQGDVEQYQAMVNSLSAKLVRFQGYLADAEANRSHTLDNRNKVDQLVQQVIDLQNNSKIAFAEMGQADARTKTLATQINTVISRLIYSAEVINKLSNLVNRKKEFNPLISDDLVSMVSKAGADANSAVSVTLVALKSVFAAQATGMEANSATSLEYQQSISLYNLLTGSNVLSATAQSDNPGQGNQNSLRQLLYTAYSNAQVHYLKTQQACITTTRQLNQAQAQLNAAQVKLASLQSALAAGNAAALAS